MHRQVDLFMGGLAESHAPGAIVGSTCQAIIARQFFALRAGGLLFLAESGFRSEDRSSHLKNQAKRSYSTQRRHP
jgi:hypothetical protein